MLRRPAVRDVLLLTAPACVTTTIALDSKSLVMDEATNSVLYAQLPSTARLPVLTSLGT